MCYRDLRDYKLRRHRVVAVRCIKGQTFDRRGASLTAQYPRRDGESDEQDSPQGDNDEVDVAAWLANPADNQGWAFISDDPDEWGFKTSMDKPSEHPKLVVVAANCP